VVTAHKARFASFSVIGAAVFVMGLVMQMVLVRYVHLSPIPAFVIQGVVSVQISFLANRNWTWRDQDVSFFLAWYRFNVQKIATSIANALVYAGMVKVGVDYIAANVATTAVFTVVNYVGGHYWSFAPGGVLTDEALPSEITVKPRTRWPSVSVIVPCKDNAETIRETVQSLLGQHYPALEEVILVGSTGDTTWQALTDVRDPRLVILEQERVPGLRDPAIKRDKGLRKATGEILALADSDIVMESQWLLRGVTALIEQGAGVVAGGMRSIHDTFWGRFVDSNRLGAKTPRLPAPYLVTAQNFGRRNRKPPVTANAIFTREVYDAHPLDTSWMYGYEDYEWFWRIVKGGVRIMFTDQLTGRHHHRRSFRRLVHEYKRAAGGCAKFIKRHPDSPLARKRLMQVIALPISGLLALAAAVAAVMTGHALAVAVAITAGTAVLTAREVAHSRTAESVVYPVAGAVLGLVFTASLARGMLTPSTRAQGKRARAKASLNYRPALLFLAALAAGGALRFWQLATKPGWQYDEAVYSRVTINLLRHGTLNGHITVNTQWQPYLYQPPFYFLALSRWFAAIGVSIYHARILGVLCALTTLVLLFRLMWRIHGPHAALFTLLPVIFDGWLLYIQRASYIENPLLTLVTAGFLLYQRAMQKPTWQRFALAGGVIGFAAVFKHTGIYGILAIGLCWLIRRQQRQNHLVLLGTAATVLLVYAVVMIHFFDVPGHNWYTQQTAVQFERVLGLRHSGGTLTSPVKALHLLLAQYRVFAASLAVAVAAFAMAIWRVLRCCRMRSWQPLTRNAVLFSWMTAGVVVFGVSSLRFPQYFALILVPAYCFFWSEVWHYDWRQGIKYAAMVTAVMAGLASWWLRIPSQEDNAFADAQRYAATHIPPGAIVVTEETMGDLIQQPWCKVEYTPPCQHSASYAITWKTYLQSSWQLGGPEFAQMMHGATPIASFTGFSGTATVWRLK